jgi:transposase
MSIGGKLEVELPTNMKTNLEIQKSVEVGNNLTVNATFENIKLGIDWHAAYYRVVRMIDQGGPQPAQRFTPKAFLDWAEKQKRLARHVFSCYEAGCGGYVLHRKLIALGITNFVVVPRNLDDEHKGVRNDSREARQLALNLDRFLLGNSKAMRVVRVPTPEQEQRRQHSRQRDQMQQQRLSLAAQGRSLLLSQGWRQSNQWWKGSCWATLRSQLPEWLSGRLEIFRRVILAVNEELKTLTKELQQAAPSTRPKGMGAMSFEQLESEVADWGRFTGRKRAGSYAGLTGGVESSGDYHCDLPITKAGNPRLRHILIELAWRMVAYQSRSRLIQKWKHVLLNPKAHSRARKKAIVAVARQLMVDLWRWRTGRTSPEQLGWIMC